MKSPEESAATHTASRKVRISPSLIRSSTRSARHAEKGRCLIDEDTPPHSRSISEKLGHIPLRSRKLDTESFNI